VVCVLVEGFALADDEARDIFRPYNATCQPPWAEHEIEHKLHDARERIDPAKLGHLLTLIDPVTVGTHTTR